MIFFFESSCPLWKVRNRWMKRRRRKKWYRFRFFSFACVASFSSFSLLASSSVFLFLFLLASSALLRFFSVLLLFSCLFFLFFLLFLVILSLLTLASYLPVGDQAETLRTLIRCVGAEFNMNQLDYDGITLLHAAAKGRNNKKEREKMKKKKKKNSLRLIFPLSFF